MKTTINEIARIARVAKSTVSKALNGHKGVSEEKRQYILELAKKLNYEPSATAQALASNRTGSIGLLIPHEAAYSLSGAYWSAMITAIAQTATRHNYSLLILTTPHEGEISAPINTVIRRRNVDGLIIGAEQIDAAATSRLIEEEIPFVFIGRNSWIHHYAVDVDNLGGSERLVSHIIEQGYRKIGCLGGPPQYLYTQERVQGYQRALQKAGITWEAIYYTEYKSEETRRVLGEMLQDHPDMDALCVTAGGDLLLDCIDVLRFAGIHLKRFGLGAFDDYRFFDYLDIPVCTVRQPIDRLGEIAASMLFSLLHHRKPPVMQQVLDVELVLR
ncbi:MAG TPA: LacI family DNA-binding transcriptional regulator [Termitinemataceae bacterium]|nr:LacI family DNA-binding transcriptional regulator [Termitinemataceae bacterium]HOM23656.1 LacI family DNA-binding transcriptional regulator [Termitinemataceae bacterium]HPQ01390.1 LacI family DNA-binding transcriptional regulator [Termitinemataceae bacterium]